MSAANDSNSIKQQPELNPDELEELLMGTMDGKTELADKVIHTPDGSAESTNPVSTETPADEGGDKADKTAATQAEALKKAAEAKKSSKTTPAKETTATESLPAKSSLTKVPNGTDSSGNKIDLATLDPTVDPSIETDVSPEDLPQASEKSQPTMDPFTDPAEKETDEAPSQEEETRPPKAASTDSPSSAKPDTPSPDDLLAEPSISIDPDTLSPDTLSPDTLSPDAMDDEDSGHIDPDAFMASMDGGFSGMANISNTDTSAPAPVPGMPNDTNVDLLTSSMDMGMDVEQLILERMISELNSYKEKVVQQDITIFEMRALLQSGKGFSNILNLDQLLDSFMAVIREKYSVTNTAVLLLDDLDHSHDYYRVRAYHGLEDYYEDENGYKESMIMFKFPKNNGLLWQLIQQGMVFSVQNIKREPRFEHAWRHWRLEALNSSIWCPLIKMGEVLGILTIGETEDGTPIRESDYTFIQELSSIATTNIDSTLKYEKNIRILKNIQTLYDINQQIASVNDFKQLCHETLANALEALQAQKANLMLFNKQTGKLEIRVVMGDIPEHIKEQINTGMIETKSFSIGEGIAGECAMLKRPIRVNDRHEIPQVGRHEVYSILSVPIIYGNELEGVINMTNKVRIDAEGNKVVDPLGRFTEDDTALLVGLADQAAVNLHKSRLYSASITDRLTGLYNSRYFEQVLSEKMSDSVKNGHPLTLGIVDIDHFKKFNDSYGHAVGDAVLERVAKLFKHVCRSDRQDMAFRYGGEELCILFPNTSPSEAVEMLEAFRDMVANSPIQHNGEDVYITVSIGQSTSIMDCTDERTLFENADSALYEGKKGGRNQVRVYAKGQMLTYERDSMMEKIRLAYV